MKVLILDEAGKSFCSAPTFRINDFYSDCSQNDLLKKRTRRIQTQTILSHMRIA